MKRLLLLAFCLAFALPARASTDPFAEFRIPDHAWRSGTAGLAFSADRHQQSAAGSFDRGNLLYSNLNGGLRAGWDSDALQYGFGLGGSGRLTADHSRSGSDTPPYTQREEGVGHQSAEAWMLDGWLRAYPWKTPVGLGISAEAQGAYSQSWSRSDYRINQDYPVARRSDTRRAGASHNYETVVFADLSVGFGRVRDASVVYDVHLLEERLLETGALTRPLSADARARLAALSYVAPFYSVAHQRPDRFVWDEIERVLREDGALGERGLDPRSVMRAREPYAPGNRPMRQRGWFVGLVSQVTTRNYINRWENELTFRLYDSDILTYEEHNVASQRTVFSYDQAMLGGQAEYHLPVGWRWQLDAATRAAGPARPGENGLDVSNRVSLSWFVADRWAASASVAQARDYFRPRGSGGALASNRWASRAVASVAYYLEDRTSLSLTLSEAQTRAQYSPYDPQAFHREGRISLGISFRFIGRLDAPGLIEPVSQLY